MKRRFSSILGLLVLASAALFAERPEAAARPDLGIVVLNLIAPGVAQISEGKSEGWFYLPGSAMLAAGAIGMYATSSDPMSLTQPSLSILAESGSALWAYSLFAYMRDVGDKAASGEGRPLRGRESFLELLGAPFLPENILSVAVFPALILETASAVDAEDLTAIGQYWALPTVSVAGFTGSPAAAFALVMGFAATMSLFTALAEEIIYRGLVFDSLGDPLSALLFGAVHLGNLAGATTFTPHDPVEVAKQTVHATALGFYLDWISDLDSRRLRRTVTFHFWNNLFAYLLAYMEQSSQGQYTPSTSRKPSLPPVFSLRMALD